jgi:hypothetical protein
VVLAMPAIRNGRHIQAGAMVWAAAEMNCVPAPIRYIRLYSRAQRTEVPGTTNVCEPPVNLLGANIRSLFHDPNGEARHLD